MHNILSWWIGLWFLLFLGLMGCKNEVKELPAATGNLSELLVIADSSWQKGIPRQLVEKYFGAPFPGSTTDLSTPLFELRFVTPTQFLNSTDFRTQRNCLILLPKQPLVGSSIFQALKYRLSSIQKKTLQDSNVVAAHNLWSDHQLALFVTANDPADFASYWNRYLPVLYQKLKKNDAYLVEQKLAAEEPEYKIENTIRQQLNINLSVPKGFELIQDKDSIIWLHRQLPLGGNCWILLRTMNGFSWPENASEAQNTFLSLIKNTLAPSTLSIDQHLKIYDQQIVNESMEKKDPHFLSYGKWQSSKESVGQRGSFHGQLIQLYSYNKKSLLAASFIQGTGEFQREWMLICELIVSKISASSRP